MVAQGYTQEIMAEVEKLAPDKQRRVLEFVRGLTRPRGESGAALLESLATLDFSPEDLKEIAEAVENCEKVDWDEWDLPAGH